MMAYARAKIDGVDPEAALKELKRRREESGEDDEDDEDNSGEEYEIDLDVMDVIPQHTSMYQRPEKQ